MRLVVITQAHLNKVAGIIFSSNFSFILVGNILFFPVNFGLLFCKDLHF